MGTFSKAFEGTNVVKDRFRAYGNLNGFNFCAVHLPNASEVQIRINYRSDKPDIKEKINQVFANMKAQNKKLLSIEIDDYSILIHQRTQSQKKMVQLTESTVKQIISFLAVQECTSGCGVCGNSEAVFYEVNGGMNCLCANCSNEIAGKLEQNRQAAISNKSKVVPGLVGALIGSLIGAALWILIYQMGYISGIAGAVTIICALKGYEKLGGCLDVKGVIVAFAFSLVMIFIAEQAAVSISLARELDKYGYDYSVFEVYKELPDWLEMADAKGDYIQELVIGYILALVVGIPFVFNALKDAKGSYSIKKM